MAWSHTSSLSLSFFFWIMEVPSSSLQDCCEGRIKQCTWMQSIRCKVSYKCIYCFQITAPAQDTAPSIHTHSDTLHPVTICQPNLVSWRNVGEEDKRSFTLVVNTLYDSVYIGLSTIFQSKNYSAQLLNGPFIFSLITCRTSHHSPIKFPICLSDHSPDPYLYAELSMTHSMFLG